MEPISFEKRGYTINDIAEFMADRWPLPKATDTAAHGPKWRELGTWYNRVYNYFETLTKPEPFTARNFRATKEQADACVAEMKRHWIDQPVALPLSDGDSPVTVAELNAAIDRLYALIERAERFARSGS